jgi:hypothetical protein
LHSPLFFERVGSEAYLHKGTRGRFWESYPSKDCRRSYSRLLAKIGLPL